MPDRIEPFVIGVEEAVLDDLRGRLRRARWPEREPVGDWSQGVPLSYLQDLCRYWAEGYDWRATEARLNRIPQFTTVIDGLGMPAFSQPRRPPAYRSRWVTALGALDMREPPLCAAAWSSAWPPYAVPEREFCAALPALLAFAPEAIVVGQDLRQAAVAAVFDDLRRAPWPSCLTTAVC
jgi:hypothetical protein